MDEVVLETCGLVGVTVECSVVRVVDPVDEDVDDRRMVVL